MHVFGLTGGIATGKSTVTAMVRALGVPVIDADALAREVVEPGQPALEAIAARFPGVVVDGALDRAKLGALVFQDPAARTALNQLLHPRIRALAEARLADLAGRGFTHAFYDAALLFENRLHEGLQGSVLVTAPPEVQRERLMARDGLSEAAARARIDAQMPTEEKRKHATWIIDNGGSQEATRQQVEAILAQVLRYGAPTS